MMKSIYIALVFSAYGGPEKTEHPNMQACIQHVINSRGWIYRKSGYCEEHFGGYTICFTSIMSAFDTNKQTNSVPIHCIKPELSKRLKEILIKENRS